MGLRALLEAHAAQVKLESLDAKIKKVTEDKSVKDLYMAYSVLYRDFDAAVPTSYGESGSGEVEYLKRHKANILDIARIYFLSSVLKADPEFFIDKVANIIQVADTRELETFLRYLDLLPEAQNFNVTAVEALRTNIATLFDAISLDNPYPAKYFNDQQWNQMYLKAAFMERDLSMIRNVDERANRELTRIISDYAHERWAASRTIDPQFWRPVTGFLDGDLLKDMERLLQSQDPIEQRAGALCCYFSDAPKAKELLAGHQALVEEIKSKKLNWNTLKQ